jgi:copper chaperone CopZ
MRAMILAVNLFALLLGACGDSSPPDSRVSDAAPIVLHLQVDGMHCQGCVDAITDKVGRVDGVVDCRVNLENRQADVAVRQATAGPAVQRAIEGLGYKVTPLK